MLSFTSLLALLQYQQLLVHFALDVYKRQGGKIHLCALQCQRGAVGQTGGIKVALRLGQIDADAAQNAPALLLVAVAHALAQLSLIHISAMRWAR